RSQLTRRLGVARGRAVHGRAQTDAVPDEAIRAMSTRAAEIATATAANGFDSARARQVAAFDTRSPKNHSVDVDDLRIQWTDRLATAGFDANAARRTLGVASVAPPTVSEEQALYTHLASASGVTEQANTFDRRAVLQAVAAWSGN